MYFISHADCLHIYLASAVSLLFPCHSDMQFLVLHASSTYCTESVVTHGYSLINFSFVIDKYTWSGGAYKISKIPSSPWMTLWSGKAEIVTKFLMFVEWKLKLPVSYADVLLH